MPRKKKNYSSKSQSIEVEAGAFLGRYERKVAKKCNGHGNFRLDDEGDLVTQHRLSHHAVQRARERGISRDDAVRKHAVLSSDGTIVTTFKKNSTASLVQELRTATLPSGHVKLEMEIPNKVVGRIIGKMGARIQKLQGDYGVRAQVTKARTGKETQTLVLVGPEISVHEASKEVENNIEFENQTSKEKNLRTNANRVSLLRHGLCPKGHELKELRIPADLVGHIIGKKGAKLTGLKDRHNVEAAIEDTREFFYTLLLRGPSTGVKGAAKEITTFLQKKGYH